MYSNPSLMNLERKGDSPSDRPQAGATVVFRCYAVFNQSGPHVVTAGPENEFKNSLPNIEVAMPRVLRQSISQNQQPPAIHHTVNPFNLFRPRKTKY